MRTRPCTRLHARRAGLRAGLVALLMATLLSTGPFARSVAAVVLRAVDAAGMVAIQRSLAGVGNMRRALDVTELGNSLGGLRFFLAIATAGLAGLVAAV